MARPDMARPASPWSRIALVCGIAALLVGLALLGGCAELIRAGGKCAATQDCMR